MGTIMPSRMHDISMTEYLFVQWYDEDQIDLFKYEFKYICDYEDAVDFIRQFRWDDNCNFYWRDLLQQMDDQSFAIHRMTDSQVQERLAELLSQGQLKAYFLAKEEEDGDDFEYAEEAAATEKSKVAEGDKSPIRKPQAKPKEKPADAAPAPVKQEPKATTAETTKPGENPCGNAAPGTSETCTNGCPISMVTGEELLEQVDFTLSGPLQLAWARTYRSSNRHNSIAGYGWTNPLTEYLYVEDAAVKLFNQEGRIIEFPMPEIGSESKNITEKMSLRRETNKSFSLQDAKGLVKVFRGTGRFRLEMLGDASGNSISIAWGDHNTPSQVDTSWGKRLWLIHDQNQRITEIISSNNPVANNDENNSRKPEGITLVRYGYDAEGDLVTVTDRNGATDEFRYNNHQIAQRTLKNGLNFYFEWDGTGPDANCLHNWADNGLYDYHFEWYPEEKKSTSTDSNGAKFTYYYNDHGKIIREIDPYGNVTRTTYNKAGRVIRKTDPNQAVTNYKYDKRYNLISVINSEGHAHKISYDEMDRPTLLKDPLGNRWKRRYNDQGKLVKTEDPQGNATEYFYNANGLPVKIVNPKGAARELHWDDRARLVGETDFAGNLSSYRYDNDGNIIAIKSPEGKETQYHYNSAGKVDSATLPDGKKNYIKYDKAGNITEVIDPAGRSTRFEYGGMTQLQKRIDPNGQVLEYFYDNEENLTGLKNEKGELYQLHYDLNENLVEEIGFDGRIQKYEYDAAGHLVRHHQYSDQPGAAIQTDFVRNSLGQLLSSKNGDDISLFEYDQLGRLVTANNNHRNLGYRYDERGLLVQEWQDNNCVSHQYDELGLRIASLLPDGQKLDFGFDALGAYTSVYRNDSLLTEVSRDHLGRETTRKQGNTLSESSYDKMGRLSRIKVANRTNSQTIIQREYGYDAAGNLALVNDLKKGETHFSYDPLNRLTAVQGVLNETFEHDPAGNILENNGETTQVEKGNRLKFQGDRHFKYDARGNLIQENRGKGGQLVTQFEYNGQNQLIKVIKGKQEIEYRYDALGRRVSKKDNFGKTQFLWNGNQLLSETRGEIHKTYLFEPGGFRPLAFVQDDKVYHYHVDHLGTPQEISNEQGEIVWSVSYRAYGNVVKKEIEQVENNLRFQGQYFDAETGLHYNRFRYYSPDTGRFINQDPIGLLGGINNYQYAPNPVGWVDPLGLQCEAANGNNQKTVFAGHGTMNPDNMYTVPEGTSLTVYSWDGASITDDFAQMIEAGNVPESVYKKTYQPGEQIPEYILSENYGDLTIADTSITVNESTPIDELLTENMGECHWAACTYIFGHENKDVIHDSEGIFKKKGQKIYKFEDGSWNEVT